MQMRVMLLVLGLVAGVRPADAEQAANKPKAKTLVVCADRDQWTGKYVQLGLAPGTGDGNPAVALAESDALTRHGLAPYRTVYLVDLKRLSDAALAALHRRVQNGAGLCIFLGPSIDKVFWQRQFRPMGNSLLPVAIGTVRRWELGDEKSRLQLPKKAHSAYRVLSRLPALDVSMAHRHWTIKGAQRSQTARVIVQTAKGEPLGYSHQCGKGRVVTFLTAPDRDWTNWMLHPSWVITLQLTQRYLTGEETGPETDQTKP